MNTFRRFGHSVVCFVAVATGACGVFIPQPAIAEVIWDWSFGGTEEGTFTTDGTLADAAGSFDFTITNFTVTASTITSLIGSGYFETQPLQGFLWDGTVPTQFYRSSGSFTNGSNFFVSSPAYIYGFFADSGTVTGSLAAPNEGPTVVGPSALTITAVPEPSICVMTLAGLAYGSAIGRALLRTCGCSFTRRRRT